MRIASLASKQYQQSDKAVLTDERQQRSRAGLVRGSTSVSNDSILISAQGLNLLQGSQDGKQEEEQTNIFYKENNASLLEMYKDQMKTAEKAGEAYKDLAKIMEIARRIANGDRVPPKDEQKLMEYNPELYQAAKAAAIINADKKHKEYDSLYDDEEDGVSRDKLRALDAEGGTGGGESAGVEGSAKVADAEAAVEG